MNTKRDYNIGNNNMKNRKLNSYIYVHIIHSTIIQWNIFCRPYHKSQLKRFKYTLMRYVKFDF